MPRLNSLRFAASAALVSALAATIMLAGCSAPGDSAAPKPDKSTTQQSTTPEPSKAPAATPRDSGPITVSERQDVAPEEWCADVLDGLGVEKIARRISEEGTRTAIEADFDYGDDGYSVTCKMGSLSVIRTGFQNPALLEKRRAGYGKSATTNIGGIPGDYVYDGAGKVPAAFFTAFYANTEIIVVSMFMDREVLEESETRDFMDALVRKAGSTGVPIVIKNYG